jgi:hypothetical protein
LESHALKEIGVKLHTCIISSPDSEMGELNSTVFVIPATEVLVCISEEASDSVRTVLVVVAK